MKTENNIHWLTTQQESVLSVWCRSDKNWKLTSLSDDFKYTSVLGFRTDTDGELLVGFLNKFDDIIDVRPIVEIEPSLRDYYIKYFRQCRSIELTLNK